MQNESQQSMKGQGIRPQMQRVEEYFGMGSELRHTEMGFIVLHTFPRNTYK